ncbi:hypothetical protein T03_12208, partial [Trichinella britovi]
LGSQELCLLLFCFVSSSICFVWSSICFVSSAICFVSSSICFVSSAICFGRPRSASCRLHFHFFFSSLFVSV